MPPKQKPMAASRPGSRARLGAEDVETRRPDGAGPRRVGRSSPMPGHHLVAVGDRLPAAVVVEGEGHVARARRRAGPPGPWHGRRAPAPRGRRGRRVAGRCRRVGQGEGADHGAAVGFVGDVAGSGHGCTVPAARCTPYWRRCAGNLVASCNRDWSAAWRRWRRPAAGRLRLGVPDADHHPRHQASTTTTTGGHAPTTTPPAPPSGPLTLGAPIALPFSADRVTAAESPDGAVFAAPRTRPTVPVGGLGGRRQRPGAIAEHIPTGIAALGGRQHQLLRRDVRQRVRLQPHQREPGRAVDHAGRAHGQQLGQRPGRARRGHGTVFVSVTQGNNVSVYSINPGAADRTPPGRERAGRRHRVRRLHLLRARRSPPGGAAPERGHRRRPGAGRHAQRPGWRRAVLDVVAGGAVWVSEPAGQGLDATYTTYDAATLHQLGLLQGLGDEHRGGRHAGAWRSRRPATIRPARRRAVHADVVRLQHRAAGLGHQPRGVGPPSRCSAPARRSSRRTTRSGQFDLIRLS